MKIIFFSLALLFSLFNISHAKEQHVRASWYATGTKTASGKRFNPHGMTVAHRTLAFGTKVKITNPANGKSVYAVVNDRGPFIKGRQLDVSLGVARVLGFVERGIARLVIEILH